MAIIKELEHKYILNTYNRQMTTTPLFVKGEGVYLFDQDGKKYFDFLSGLAVNVVGHCHPQVVKAIRDQAEKLGHTSNLYYTAPQTELAAVLVENTLPGGKIFFANSGAEANEAAIKLARKYRKDRFKIITAHNSFHGRTLATVTATGQPKYHLPFAPLVDGFSYGKFNDLASFADLIDAETAAIMIEPVQGEGGIHVAEESFLQGLRKLCDEHDLILIFDEVQCGMGRTGKLWAYEHWAIKPDLLTAAKGLGGGLPIGAMIVSDRLTDVLQPGDHASTFGGNPIVCNAANAVLSVILNDSFLSEVGEKGAIIEQELAKLVTERPDLIGETRGLGLMRALELKKPLAKDVFARCTEAGLLINAIGDTTLRFLPPLTVTRAELLAGLQILKKILKEIN